MTEPAGDWRGEVLRYWFGLKPEQWWRADPTVDDEVRARFLDLWKQKRQLPPESFLGDALAALAAVILFDQFPRNMFRGHADQFSTDTLALAVAKGAVERGFDEKLDKAERPFLYMPFQHSESLDDQQRSLALYTRLGDDFLLGYARKHHDVIARFGRFPHRNAMLGRAPRPDEIAAGEVVPW
ncbi:MAG TPA: DUF924 family protein [Sphingomicrobium sp.]|nr:DUF924 family protein [Sphingomicrobium sp.]